MGKTYTLELTAEEAFALWTAAQTPNPSFALDEALTKLEVIGEQVKGETV